MRPGVPSSVTAICKKASTPRNMFTEIPSCPSMGSLEGEQLQTGILATSVLGVPKAQSRSQGRMDE